MKLVGVAEIAGAIGLILPAALGIAPVLVLAILCLIVAFGRLGPYPF